MKLIKLFIFILYINNSYSLGVVNRHYLSDKLWSLFIESEKKRFPLRYNKNKYKDIFQKTILQILLRPDLFGGSCDIYMAENYQYHDKYPILDEGDLFKNGCPKFVQDGYHLKNKIKESEINLRAINILDNVCKNLIYLDTSKIGYSTLDNFLSLAELKSHSVVNMKNLKEVYEIYFPLIKENNNRDVAISNFVKKTKENLSNREKWKLFSYMLCRSKQSFYL